MTRIARFAAEAAVLGCAVAMIVAAAIVIDWI